MLVVSLHNTSCGIKSFAARFCIVPDFDALWGYSSTAKLLSSVTAYTVQAVHRCARSCMRAWRRAERIASPLSAVWDSIWRRKTVSGMSSAGMYFENRCGLRHVQPHRFWSSAGTTPVQPLHLALMPHSPHSEAGTGRAQGDRSMHRRERYASATNTQCSADADSGRS